SAAAREVMEVLTQALDEARAIQAELERTPRAAASASWERHARWYRGEPLRAALEPARVMLCRSAARREIGVLLGPDLPSREPPAVLALAVPPGRVPGLRGFNLCFFAFLCFQTLVWGAGAVCGTDL